MAKISDRSGRRGVVAVKRAIDYQETLIKGLKGPHEVAEYLNSVLEQGDQEMFLIALCNVAAARGGLSRLSRTARPNRSNLHRMLSKHGNPEVKTLAEILHSFGLSEVRPHSSLHGKTPAEYIQHLLEGRLEQPGIVDASPKQDHPHKGNWVREELSKWQL